MGHTDAAPPPGSLKNALIPHSKRLWGRERIRRGGHSSRAYDPDTGHHHGFPRWAGNVRGLCCFQIAAIREGICEVVPPAFLAVVPWWRPGCGSPDAHTDAPRASFWLFQSFWFIRFGVYGKRVFIRKVDRVSASPPPPCSKHPSVSRNMSHSRSTAPAREARVQRCRGCGGARPGRDPKAGFRRQFRPNLRWAEFLGCIPVSLWSLKSGSWPGRGAIFFSLHLIPPS